MYMDEYTSRWYSAYSSILRFFGRIPRKVQDTPGVWLTPGKPKKCHGYHPELDGRPANEICCDECNWYLLCFPHWWKALHPGCSKRQVKREHPFLFK